MKRTKIAPAPGYTTHNKITLVRGGHDYFSLLIELIEKAKTSIHLHVYIFEEDETGIAVANALVEAARRKVKVYLLFDGYASRDLSKLFIENLKNEGIHFRMFEPVFQTSRFYVGRRMHHKVFVSDSLYSLVGGLNISNRYNDIDGQPAWLDWALYAEGDISTELLKVLVKLWTKSKVKARKILEQEPTPPQVKEKCLVRIRRNDWAQRKTQITNSYFEMFKKATSHITIMSSYFLPGLIFQKELLRACKRGIDVKLILAGTSDILIAKHAERYIYRWLFRHNIRVFEYQKSVLHGKLATYDNEKAILGSYNVNNLSAFASIELNLDVYDAAFASTLNASLEDIIRNDCIEITTEHYTRFSIFSRLIQWSSYFFLRISFYLFTFYWKQNKA